MARTSAWRGRFAPSPTGRLHLGNARSALLGFLQAKSAGGEFLLRVEDLDAGRCRPEHTQTLREDLAYLGLSFDGELWFQSARAAFYDAALESLRTRELVYECFCTRAEVARAASAPHGPSDEGPVYPGSCRALSERERSEKRAARKPSWRFRVAAGLVSFEDGLHGRYAQDVEREVGDFVVRRHDGVASYQLAVVVDDAASLVTDVLRADDLLTSTPRQLLLYDALSLVRPAFHHVPLLLGEDGKRLAKREGASAVADLRARGVPSERVLGLLADSAGFGTGKDASLEELLARFSMERISRAPYVVTEQALRERLGF